MIMGNGNGKRLVPGLENYLKGSDFYRDPMWKALVRHERSMITGARSFEELKELAEQNAKKKYFLAE
jgi:hypothetical protein